MTSNRIIPMLCLATVMGGCASGLPLRQISSDNNKIILTDTSAVMTVNRPRDPGMVTCSRMSADVSVSRTESVSVSTLNFGDEAESDGEQETELQGRTPGLLAMRDALFHSCLMYQSGTITSMELLNMTQSILARSYNLLEIEAKNSQWVYNEQAAFSASGAVAGSMPAVAAAQPASGGSSPPASSSSDEFADFN